MRWLCRWEEFHHGEVSHHTFNSYLTADRHWSNKTSNFSFHSSNHIVWTFLHFHAWIDQIGCTSLSNDLSSTLMICLLCFSIWNTASLWFEKCEYLLTSFNHFCWVRCVLVPTGHLLIIRFSACHDVDNKSCWPCDVDQARWRTERPCSWHYQAIWSQRLQASRNQGILLCLNYTCIWNCPLSDLFLVYYLSFSSRRYCGHSCTQRDCYTNIASHKIWLKTPR